MDKTIEELKAELEAYQKRSIEKAISEEKEKEAIRLTAEKAKEKEALELEFMKKHNIGAQSKANTDGSQQATNLTGDSRGWNDFADHFTKRAQAQGLDIKGRNYEEILQNIQNKRRL
jgi:SOS-response transcriptional repressor LexA